MNKIPITQHGFHHFHYFLNFSFRNIVKRQCIIYVPYSSVYPISPWPKPSVRLPDTQMDTSVRLGATGVEVGERGSGTLILCMTIIGPVIQVVRTSVPSMAGSCSSAVTAAKHAKI